MPQDRQKYHCKNRIAAPTSQSFAYGPGIRSLGCLISLSGSCRLTQTIHCCHLSKTAFDSSELALLDGFGNKYNLCPFSGLLLHLKARHPPIVLAKIYTASNIKLVLVRLCTFDSITIITSEDRLSIIDYLF